MRLGPSGRTPPPRHGGGGVMRAWAVGAPDRSTPARSRLVERPVPSPGPGQVRVRVSVCGVCRTDLHLAEGDLAPIAPAWCPATRSLAGSTVWARAAPAAEGDRIGMPWLAGRAARAATAGRGREPLPGAALHRLGRRWRLRRVPVVDERYAYLLPDGAAMTSTPRPCCAPGIIGYRALRRAELPPGGRLGIYGFGGSAHLTAQVALAAGGHRPRA